MLGHAYLTVQKLFAIPFCRDTVGARLNVVHDRKHRGGINTSYLLIRYMYSEVLRMQMTFADNDRGYPESLYLVWDSAKAEVYTASEAMLYYPMTGLIGQAILALVKDKHQLYLVRGNERSKTLRHSKAIPITLIGGSLRQGTIFIEIPAVIYFTLRMVKDEGTFMWMVHLPPASS